MNDYHDTEHPTDDDFDRFARRAGESLRAPAPDQGVTDVVAAGRRRQGAQLVGAIAVVAMLIIGIAAIRSRATDDAIARPTVPTTAAPTTDAASTTSAASLAPSPLDGWTISYTGNPTGPVAGKPFRVGVIQYAGGLAEVDSIQSGKTYLNSSGGGVAGHPIELVVCDNEVTVECAARLGTDPSVSAVLWSALEENATAELLTAMGTAKASLTPFVCSCQEKAVVGRVASLQVSHLDAVAGAAHLLDRLDTSGRIGLFGGNDASAAVVRSIVGAERTVVLPSYATTSAQVRDILTAANASDVRNFIGEIGFDTCKARGNALREAVPDGTFVGIFCDDLADGWYNVGPGFTSTLRPTEAGAATIPVRLADAGSLSFKTDDGDVNDNMQARWAADLFVLARIVNQLGGVEKATPDAIEAAIQSYKGPVPLTGDVDCTTAKANGTCVTTVPVFQLKDGTWIEHPAVSAKRGP